MYLQMLNFCQSLTSQPQLRQTEIEANRNYWRKVFDIVTGKSNGIETSGDLKLESRRAKHRILSNTRLTSRLSKILDIRLNDFLFNKYLLS